MSAIHIYLESDAVHVLNDGATYDRDGVLFGSSSKTVSIPHLNCAISSIGPTFVASHLVVRIAEFFQTFDELLGGIVEKLRDSVLADQPLFAKIPGSERFSVFIVGISETRGPIAYAIHSEETDGLRPWELEHLPEGKILPITPEFQASLASRQDLLFDPEEFDPAVHGLAILEAQRQFPGRILGSGELRYAIGAHASLTTVRRDAIQTRILRRWPDRVGEKIRPNAGQATILDRASPDIRH